MKASVIIPAYNAAPTIARCLAALRKQEATASYEIIVVDDCSDDKTAELASAHGVTLIRHRKRRGAAGARNSGIEAARGDIICFTDADCVPRMDWVSQMLRPFEELDIAGCKGIYATRQPEIVARFVQLEYEDKYDLLSKQDRIDFIDTYSAAYRRQILQSNDGFDEQFAFLEDQELSFRLAARGYQMVFQPKAVVYHVHSDSVARYFRKKFTIGQWKAQITRRFPDRVVQDSHTPQVMKLQMLLMALMLISLAGIVVTRWSAPLLLALAAVFMLSTIPFVRKAWAKDMAVAAVSPLLLMVRAAALGSGYAWGLVNQAAELGNEHTLHGVDYFLKRSMDIVGGVAGLFGTLLLFPFIGLAIKLDSDGPIIYSQERIGEHGRPFTLYKFRSMINQPERSLAELLEEADLDPLLLKAEDDPRLTRTGRFLRRWSLDELPQFWNVLKGEMSLVGPRPEETRIVQVYNDWQRRRLSVKPGITGPMQVSGRAELSLNKRVELELDYIGHYSIFRDFKLLLLTIPAIIRGYGAR